jgi:CheY-like chemotaxis protein
MKQVWMVDDDQEMCQAISLMLSLLDCQTRVFNDPRQAARALLAGEFPHLLVLDINMPVVTGLDLLEFIRRRPKWESLPILIISAEATDADVDRAMSMGANGYLIKPVSFEELEKTFNKLVPAQP